MTNVPPFPIEFYHWVLTIYGSYHFLAPTSSWKIVIPHLYTRLIRMTKIDKSDPGTEYIRRIGLKVKFQCKYWRENNCNCKSDAISLHKHWLKNWNQRQNKILYFFGCEYIVSYHRLENYVIEIDTSISRSPITGIIRKHKNFIYWIIWIIYTIILLLNPMKKFIT